MPGLSFQTPNPLKMIILSHFLSFRNQIHFEMIIFGCFLSFQDPNHLEMIIDINLNLDPLTYLFAQNTSSFIISHKLRLSIRVASATPPLRTIMSLFVKRKASLIRMCFSARVEKSPSEKVEVNF